ncbi:copper resistance CopC family protein [Kribbella sp. CA-247076]|uniref:copper resistance CopC family protein n=1 Tax=Kribbella sp. CA-247076 TaxID=3239941 RepID=UPI003D8DF7F4
MRRLIAVLTVSLLGLVVSIGPAAAHAKLESMTPADGASMAAPPTRVVLTFSEPIGANGTRVEVKSPSGKNVATGDVQVDDKEVTQRVGAMVEAGRYQVDARVVSADGHPIMVTAAFTVTHDGHPPDQPAGTGPTGAQGNSNTVTIVAMGLIMLVVVALAVVIVRRRPATE